jgi:hypothetical protein
MQTIEASRETATPAIEPAPRWAGWFVRSFLAAFVVCAVVGIEAWPLTGFRLFSHLRYANQTEWQAFAVRPDGSEAWLPLSRVHGGYNGFPLVMKSFASRTPEQRTNMCRAWTVAAAALQETTVAIRIYTIERRLEPRNGRHAAHPPRRTLAYTCGGGTEQKGSTGASG